MKPFLHALSLLLLVLIIGMPLLTCLLEMAAPESAGTAGAFVEAGAWRYFTTGFITALGATLIAIAAGGALAWTGVPRRGRWIAIAALIPLITPPTVYGLAWNALWAMPKSPVLAAFRVMLAMGLAFSPLIFLLILAARALQDPAMLEAARLAGIPPLRRFFRIHIASTTGAIAAGAMAVFLLAFSSFEIPAALNYRSFPEAIYQRYQQANSLGAPAALAIAAVSPALILAWIAWRAIHRMRSSSLAFHPAIPTARNAAAWLPWIAYIALAIATPASGLWHRVEGNLPLAAMRKDLLEGVRETLPVVLSALGIALVLGWMLAEVVIQRRIAGLAALALAFIGAGVAPAILGIGLIRFWIRLPEGGFVFGNNAIYILGLLGRSLILPILAFVAARQILPAAYGESARTAGLSYATRQLRLLIPATAMAWVAVAAAGLALMLGELGATTLLSAPGTELLSFRLHSRIHIGPESYVAAFSVMYAAVVLALAAAFWAGGTWAVRGGRRA